MIKDLEKWINSRILYNIINRSTYGVKRVKYGYARLDAFGRIYNRVLQHAINRQQVAEKFAVSSGVVYYWIERGVLEARRLNRGSPYWITLEAEKEAQLQDWVSDSSRINRN